MRKVTVYSTIGNDMKEVMVSSNVWGDLQQEFTGLGIATGGMKAIIGESQVTLESNQAVLPESNFTLFLTPQKVKSGGWFGDDNENEEDHSVDNTPKGMIKAKIVFITDELNELYTMVDLLAATSTDPSIAVLKAKAAEIKRNLGLFD